MDFAYCEEYVREYIIQNIIMAVLRKANSHSVVICRLTKKVKNVKEGPSPVSRLLEKAFIIYETPPPPCHDLIISPPFRMNSS